MRCLRRVQRVEPPEIPHRGPARGHVQHVRLRVPPRVRGAPARRVAHLARLVEGGGVRQRARPRGVHVHEEDRRVRVAAADLVGDEGEGGVEAAEVAGGVGGAEVGRVPGVCGDDGVDGGDVEEEEGAGAEAGEALESGGVGGGEGGDGEGPLEEEGVHEVVDTEPEGEERRVGGPGRGAGGGEGGGVGVGAGEAGELLLQVVGGGVRRLACVDVVDGFGAGDGEVVGQWRGGGGRGGVVPDEVLDPFLDAVDWGGGDRLVETERLGPGRGAPYSIRHPSALWMD